MMFKIGTLLLALWVILGGCVYYDEPAPQIVHGPTDSKGTLILPSTMQPRRTSTAFARGIPRDWLPPEELEKSWTAIVIHHSGTTEGNSAIFDKWHREGNHWEGIGYDFVIGNGTGSGNGEVEVTFRWLQQRTGAHCKTPDNWANLNAVGICLVGDFNHSSPTQRQMESLVKLIRFLQRRYNIPKSHIYGHNTTPGARVTDCPGHKFPMAELKSMLDV